jgi:hypothetical protein
MIYLPGGDTLYLMPTLSNKYPMSDLRPLKQFLGIQVRKRTSMAFQDSYIKGVVSHYNLEGYKPTSVPLLSYSICNYMELLCMAFRDDD